MILRILLIPKGKKKEMKRRKTRQHKSRKGEERKSLRQLNETLQCIFELSGVLYLYRDFVTVLVKIATAITLMDKIKMKFIH